MCKIHRKLSSAEVVDASLHIKCYCVTIKLSLL